jgi:hypothetical protein
MANGCLGVGNIGPDPTPYVGTENWKRLERRDETDTVQIW